MTAAAHGDCERELRFDSNACGLVCVACGALVQPRQLEHIFTLSCKLYDASCDAAATNADAVNDEKETADVVVECALRSAVACSLLGLSAGEFDRLSHSEKVRAVESAVDRRAEFVAALVQVPPKERTTATKSRAASASPRRSPRRRASSARRAEQRLLEENHQNGIIFRIDSLTPLAPAFMKK